MTVSNCTSIGLSSNRRRSISRLSVRPAGLLQSRSSRSITCDASAKVLPFAVAAGRADITFAEGLPEHVQPTLSEGRQLTRRNRDPKQLPDILRSPPIADLHTFPLAMRIGV